MLTCPFETEAAELANQYYGQRDRSQPAFWDDERFNAPIQPVVGITWFEALAYCNWMSEKLDQANTTSGDFFGSIPGWEALAGQQLQVRLPTEAEWAYAAGVYPQGISRHGLHDLSGSTWEWTASLYQAYPYDEADGRNDLEKDGYRVVRGGSWDGNHRDARCACRGRFLPTGFDFNIGFRVVLSLARSES